MDGQNNKNNNHEQGDDAPQSSLGRIATELNELNTIAKKRANEEEKENTFFGWRNGRKQIKFFIELVTILMTLIAVFYTYRSVQVAHDAIIRADSANAVAKRSLDFTMRFNKESMQYQIAKDVSNDTITTNSLKIAQQNANAATNLANQSIRSLKDAAARLTEENKPYLRFIPVSVDWNIPQLNHKLVNYGKAPAIITGSYVTIHGEDFELEQIKRIIDTIKYRLNKVSFNNVNKDYAVNEERDNIKGYIFTSESEANKKGIKGRLYKYVYGKFRYRRLGEKTKEYIYSFVFRLYFLTDGVTVSSTYEIWKHDTAFDN